MEGRGIGRLPVGLVDPIRLLHQRWAWRLLAIRGLGRVVDRLAAKARLRLLVSLLLFCYRWRFTGCLGEGGHDLIERERMEWSGIVELLVVRLQVVNGRPSRLEPCHRAGGIGRSVVLQRADGIGRVRMGRTESCIRFLGLLEGRRLGVIRALVVQKARRSLRAHRSEIG